MRVLVCGGRRFADYDFLKTVLSAFHLERGPFEIVIHGAADGADSLADQWARRHLIPTLRFPADWEHHGRSAGPRRNAEMLRDGKPDLVLAFPGSRGTADMISKAKAAGVEVIETGSR